MTRVEERRFLKVGDLTPSSLQTCSGRPILVPGGTCLAACGGSAHGGAAPRMLQPAKPAGADCSPKNALAVNAKGLPMHTSLTRPVHPPVAPVVGRRHNRQLFHHLSGDPPVVEQSHNRRRNTIYFLIRRWSTMKSKRSNERLPSVFLVSHRRIKK